VPETSAISNTGPLIALAKVHRLDLLVALFSEILVPRAVSNELVAGGAQFPGREIVGIREFRIVDCQKEPDRLLLAELDSGEASVIQLAIERPGAEVLIDEKKARRVATSVYGLTVLGTGGLLLRAKKRGLIQTVKPLLEQIHANGYFLSDRLKMGILRAANEL